jgi:hypothetical protein
MMSIHFLSIVTAGTKFVQGDDSGTTVAGAPSLREYSIQNALIPLRRAHEQRDRMVELARNAPNGSAIRPARPERRRMSVPVPDVADEFAPVIKGLVEKSLCRAGSPREGVTSGTAVRHFEGCNHDECVVSSVAKE